jgi:hypothetical protein
VHAAAMKKNNLNENAKHIAHESGIIRKTVAKGEGGVKPPQSMVFASNYAALSELFTHVSLIFKTEFFTPFGTSAIIPKLP